MFSATDAGAPSFNCSSTDWVSAMGGIQAAGLDPPRSSISLQGRGDCSATIRTPSSATIGATFTGFSALGSKQSAVKLEAALAVA
jgi:hypothetical protein